jgi:hypothetical protein
MADGASVDAELTALLQRDVSSYTWVAATVRATNAATYQLATGQAVMAIGGFNGTTASPTLAQFRSDVAAGRIHYFIASGGAGGAGPSGGSGGSSSTTAAQISAWVASTYTATTVGGVTVYDLTQPAHATGTTTSATGQSA